jgi:hypothetical protein
VFDRRSLRPRSGSANPLGESRPLHVDLRGSGVDLAKTGRREDDVDRGEVLLQMPQLVDARNGEATTPIGSSTRHATQGCTPIIPSRSYRKVPRDLDIDLYRERHLVENFFQRIKCNRRVAMRFEKLAANFLAMVLFSASLVWLA